MTKEALTLALEMVQNKMYAHAEMYLKEALAKPEQEPVAWMLEGWGPDCGPYFEIYRNDEMGWRDKKEWTPLYTTPPQRTWVELTDDQINQAYADSYKGILLHEAIEAKLKENNNG